MTTNKIRTLTPEEETRKTYLFFKRELTAIEAKELHELMDKPHASAEKGQAQND